MELFNYETLFDICLKVAYSKCVCHRANKLLWHLEFSISVVSQHAHTYSLLK